MRKIRWGIAGPGKIANKFAVALKNLDCGELAAVASTSQERATAFAEAYGIPHVFCGYEAMAASQEVDAVYVATPHSHHMQVAQLFLNAGKHVLCEKPICVNARQARQLKECAAKNGVFLMEAMWTRFLPAIREAQAIIARGEIGEIRGIHADFCYAMEPGANRAYLNELAGGALLDVGVYGLHFASTFLGSHPETILALAHTNGQVDIHTNVLMKYEGGAIANITSAIGVKKPDGAWIYGSRGRIFIPGFYGATELFVTVGQEETHIMKKPLGAGFEEEIQEACRCIAAGKPESDILPLDETIAVMEQMDAVRKQIGIVYPFADEE